METWSRFAAQGTLSTSHAPAPRAPHTASRACRSFLIGPKRQFKQMFQAKRAQATVAYIVMMVRRGLPRLRASRAASRARSSAAAVCNRDLRFCGRPKDPRAHVHFHAVVRGSQVGPGGCCRERCVARPFGRRCALVWYVASYIPYGRKMLSKIMTKAGSSAMNL